MGPSPSARRRAVAARALAPLALLAGLGAPAPADAAIHACRTAGGAIQFQDRPCATASTATRGARAPAGVPGRAHRPPPLGIDPSWLEPPGGTAHAAICDARGCECGPSERTFHAGLGAAVAEALWLDGAWHRYEAAAAADAGGAVRAELEEAACDVLMSQATLLRHGERAMRDLARRAADARDLGRDTPEACDGFSETACGDYEALVLYRRARADAKALARPRGAVLAGADGD